MSPRVIAENAPFYGNNLPVLREYIPDESVDLVCSNRPASPHRKPAVDDCTKEELMDIIAPRDRNSPTRWLCRELKCGPDHADIGAAADERH